MARSYAWNMREWSIKGWRGAFTGGTVYADGRDRTVWLDTLGESRGEALRAHGEGEATRLLALEMKVLGLCAEAMAGAPKNLRVKQVLAWWLRQRTTVGRRWLSQRLG